MATIKRYGGDMMIKRSKIIIYLGTCLLLASLKVSAYESNPLSLDPETVERCKIRLKKEPYGLLTFRFIDSETQAEIDSVDVQTQIGDGKYSRPLREPRANWFPPDYHSFKFALSGYNSIIVDSIEVPIDSAVIVTILMKKGDGIIRIDLPGDSLVRVTKASLDGSFPKNELSGKIIDESSSMPISGAMIYCEEIDSALSTDSLGEFVFGLDTLKSVTLDAWHPLYDSVRYEITKDYIRSVKKIEIYFEAQRRNVHGQPLHPHNDSTVLLLVDLMSWSSPIMRGYEFENKIHTYAVHPGEVFGPTSGWRYYDCIPFRLIRELPNETAWVQFSNGFKLIAENMRSNTNFIFLSDSAVKINTKSFDAGTTVTLSLQPDYSPRGLVKQTGIRGQYYQSVSGEKSEPDSCDIIKAQVERAHMKAILALLEGDSARFAQSFSSNFRLPYIRNSLSLEEFIGQIYRERLPEGCSSKRFLGIFNLRYGEIYVQGICEDPVNERFVSMREGRSYDPQDGDVYIYWPYWHEVGRGIGSGISAVYRNENGIWKIIIFM